MQEIEESLKETLDFWKIASVAKSENPVIPVAIQDITNGEMLFIGYVNQLALAESIKTRRVVLWSTSRQELWRKGETSGDILELSEIRVNCEQNSLLFLATPVKGGACHTNDNEGNARPSCYYRRIVLDPGGDNTEASRQLEPAGLASTDYWAAP